MKKYVALMMIFLSLLFCVSCGEGNAPENSSSDKGNDTAFSVTVDILKIGKADCIIIDTGSHIVMIDAGEAENLSNVKSYLNGKKITTIDMLILTHYDKDHIGGAADIINTYNVLKVVEGPRISNNAEYLSYHSAIEGRETELIKLSQNQTASFDNCELNINIPKKLKYSEKTENNSSLVVSLVHGENKLLFCGDAMEIRLNELIAAGYSDYDLIKLPYHGNYLENYREFLSMVSPKYAVVTNSKKNPGDSETYNLLSEMDIKLYQTKNGQINITSNEGGLTVKQ